jgi:glycosyltransferase involved in cell wall biosynthesis
MLNKYGLTQVCEGRDGTYGIRIVLDTTFAGVNPTGVGIYSRRLAEHLAAVAEERGWDVRCYGPSCKGVAKGLLGGIYQEWPTYTQGVLPLRLLLEGADVVHSTSHIGPLWGPGRLVVTVHDLIFRRFPGDYNPLWLKPTQFLLPRVLKRARRVICDSEATRNDLLRLYRVPRGKTRVVYPGVDEAFGVPVPGERKTAIQKRFDIGSASFILCLGPWVRRKNLEVVVDSFASVHERVPGSLLVITGEPSAGMQGSGVAAALERLPDGARANVRTVGHLPFGDLCALMQEASALAYPSSYEGFGLPPLEAMRAGVPVVASDAVAVVEATGGAALIARAGDRREWAEALSRVLTDGAKAEELRTKGRARSAEFSWERCARETADVYAEIYMNY